MMPFPDSFEEPRFHLGRTVLIVDDPDKAFAFYQENFNASVISDSLNKEGKRLLHIGFRTPNSGLWLLTAETDEQKQMIGKQAPGVPFLVFYTDKLNDAFSNMLRNKVRIKRSPVQGPGFSFFHLFDLYGNEIVVVEL